VSTPVPAPRNLPPALAKNLWVKGQSGNPGGVGGEIRAAQKLAKLATPQAMATLIELLGDSDPRVRLIAANSILDRGLGKPKNSPLPDQDDDHERLNLRAAISLATKEELDILQRWVDRLNAKQNEITDISGAEPD